ncbi:MAG: DUF2059 domain-containing protein [Candidatus Acidiferrales bacterium]
MKLGIALIAAALLTASPLLAQTPPGAAQQKPAPTQPGQTAANPDATAPATPPVKLDPAKEAAIRHLLDITGVSKEGENIGEGWTSRVHEGMSRAIPPDQLPKFMETFTAKFNASASPSAVTDAMVAIYARHFSLEDIQGATKFYESPVGQRMVKEMSDVSRESQTVGLQMDQKIVMQVLWGMADEYPQLKQMLPPDPSKPAPAPAPSAGPAPGSSATPPATPPPSPAPKPQQ